MLDQGVVAVKRSHERDELSPGPQSGADATLYTRIFSDPTSIEAAEPEGGFAQIPVPLCDAKTILVDLPNSTEGRTIIELGVRGYRKLQWLTVR